MTFLSKKKKEAISEACKWAQLFACMPQSANCPGPLLNGMTLNQWLDGLECHKTTARGGTRLESVVLDIEPCIVR